jgi:GNAT superfamily N-acetyltransferase
MIRAVERSDFEAWSRLWQGYLDFYRAHVPESTTTHTFDRLVGQSDGMIGLVAAGDGGQLLGLAHLVFHPATWSSTCYCYLEDLFVDRSARGTTTARDLIQAVYDEADRRGASRTYWNTQQYNGAARSLYDQVGHATSFVVYER